MMSENESAFPQHGPPVQNIHLSVEQLLLAIDGELPTHAARKIDSHLSACWQCRALKESVCRSIADVSNLQNAVMASQLSLDANDRVRFQNRLAHIAAELAREGHGIEWNKKTVSRIKRLFTRNFRLIPVSFAFCLILVIAIVGTLHVSRRPASISADDVISRATAFDSHLETVTAKNVVVQKLRISSGGKEMVRTIYRQASPVRIATKVDAESADTASIAETLSRANFGWDDLLSVPAYSRWRAHLSIRKDTVEQVGPELVTLHTSTPSGLLAELSLTFRTSDYRDVAEELRLRDNRVIEVAELSYSVVPFLTIPRDVFGNSESLQVLHLPDSSPLRVGRQSSGTEAELARAEVEAMYALHGIGADLGEQVHVAPAGGAVRVSAVVVDADRKQQLVAALQPITYLKLDILTVDEAISSQTPEASDKHNGPPVEIIASSTPLLEDKLKEHFPDKDQRIAYVNQALAMIQSMSARAWALNQLANQYPERKIMLLDSSGKQELCGLLTDHIEALRENSRRFQSQISEVLSSSSNTAAANTRIELPQEHRIKGNAPMSANWQSEVHEMHSSIEAAHEAVQVLLVGAEPEERSNLQSIEVGLRTTLTQVDAEIESISRMIDQSGRQ